MNIDIIPIALTQVNWSDFLKICNEDLDVDPRRSLDASGLSLSPKAFIGALSFDEKPKMNLSRPNATWHHVSASFIIMTDSDEDTIYLASLGLHLTVRHLRRSDAMIATGTMFEWYNAIYYGCNEHQPKIIRYTMNCIQMYFVQHDFQELWGNCSRKSLPDGTFTLI